MKSRVQFKLLFVLFIEYKSVEGQAKERTKQQPNNNVKCYNIKQLQGVVFFEYRAEQRTKGQTKGKPLSDV